MNIVKKTMMSVLFGLSVLGLTTSMSANALNANAEAACPGCHGVIIGTTQAVGSGGINCPQRSVSAWLSTISKMKSKGCIVVAGTEQGIAEYLACVENPACTSSTSSTSTTSSTTTTTLLTGNYDMGIANLSGYSYSLSGPEGALYYGVQCSAVIVNNGPGMGIAQLGFSSYVSFRGSVSCSVPSCLATLMPGQSATISMTDGVHLGVPFTCAVFVSDVPGDQYIDTNLSNNTASLGGTNTSTSSTSTTSSTNTSTSSTSSTSTTSSTTSTTLCNTYVNGTTQYPYSGSGSCHSFANDDVTGLHIVRDQSYCKKHMSHLNSKGNHVHAYPHPACM